PVSPVSGQDRDLEVPLPWAVEAAEIDALPAAHPEPPPAHRHRLRGTDQAALVVGSGVAPAVAIAVLPGHQRPERRQNTGGADGSRDLPIGNGALLVNFDRHYQLRDIYYPRVGQENHTSGEPCRFGIWVDGRFVWLDDPGWSRNLVYQPDTLVTNVTLHHADLGVR